MQHYNYFENPFSVYKPSNNYNVKPGKTSKFTSVIDGYLRGNMEEGTYIPYKNYQPRLASNLSVKDSLMMNLQMYDFACNELNLYLDLNPQDEEALSLFREYKTKYDELCMKYTKEYSPIKQTIEVASNNWRWMCPWPFERGES